MKTWLRRTDLGEMIDREEFGIVEDPYIDDPDYSLGERVPCPEVARNWDPIARWREDAWWAWKKEEHNNVLEARAGLIATKIATLDTGSWDNRHLMISDSQVTIGVFGKGRSSSGSLNLIARRLAAIMISTGSRFYWRYTRTHRNHSDGPSRGAPMGVVQKEEGDQKLPEAFYRHTKAQLDLGKGSSI